MPSLLPLITLFVSLWAAAEGPASPPAPQEAAPTHVGHEHVGHELAAPVAAEVHEARFRIPKLTPPLANRLRVKLGGLEGILFVTPELSDSELRIAYAPSLQGTARILSTLREIVPESELGEDRPAPHIHLPGHDCGNPLHRH